MAFDRPWLLGETNAILMGAPDLMISQSRKFLFRPREQPLTPRTLAKLINLGLSDREIAELLCAETVKISALRRYHGLQPHRRQLSQRIRLLTDSRAERTCSVPSDEAY